MASKNRFIAWTVVVIFLGACSLPGKETVPDGHVGLLINGSTGEIVDSTLIRSGSTMVDFNRALLLFPVTAEKMDFVIEAYTSDSALYEVEFTLVYRLNKENIPALYRVYSMDYREVLIKPETRLIVRTVCNDISADQLERSLQLRLEKPLREFYSSHYLVLEGIGSLQFMRISPR